MIIDGNLIEFYSRFYGDVFPSTYIGEDGERSYKVFVNGTTRYSERRTCEQLFRKRKSPLQKSIGTLEDYLHRLKDCN